MSRLLVLLLVGTTAYSQSTDAPSILAVPVDGKVYAVKKAASVELCPYNAKPSDCGIYMTAETGISLIMKKVEAESDLADALAKNAKLEEAGATNLLVVILVVAGVAAAGVVSGYVAGRLSP